MSARTFGSRPCERIVSASSNHPATGSAFTGGVSMTTSATWSRTSELIIAFPALGSFVAGPVAATGRSVAFALMSERNPLDFTGRVAIVTGGSRGVGRGIAQRFLESGADVAICGRNQPESLPEAGGKTAVFGAADVRDPDGIDAVVAAPVERFARLDVLVNNAGGGPPADSATASPKFSTAIITLNLIAPLVF